MKLLTFADRCPSHPRSLHIPWLLLLTTPNTPASHTLQTPARHSLSLYFYPKPLHLLSSNPPFLHLDPMPLPPQCLCPLHPFILLSLPLRLSSSQPWTSTDHVPKALHSYTFQNPHTSSPLHLRKLILFTPNPSLYIPIIHSHILLALTPPATSSYT